ncbi:MAG TPA: TolC family protein, partial [Chitinophagaceae bacterium]|nr:TolC family protein [Chitinophagaceae bacterium]
LNERYNKASDQLKYYNEEGLQFAAVILNGANKGYNAGDIGYVEYIQNVNEAINIRSGYLQTINEYNQTIIQINYLLNR